MRTKPPALPDGGRIAVVAPSSPPQIRSEIEQASDYFTKLGYELVFGPHHRDVHGYLAGTDEHRAADVQWALSEPGIDMVHALGGGYGAARLYPRIDWDALGDPRIVCGFSDITALHLMLAKHGPWTTFYGPNFSRFTRRKDELTDETKEWFHRAFRAEPLGQVFEDPEDPYVLTVGGGSAEAPIVGGCMTLLCHSIGTPYEVETDGCILMIEDLDEEPYMVDAGLHHLIRAGKFDGVAGFVFGTDVNLKENTIPEYVGSSLSIEEILDELIAPLGIPAIANVPVGHGKHMATIPAYVASSLSIEEILDELIAPLGIPAIANVPVGHGKHMATIPLGARARLDADAKTLEIVEPGVA